jgi:hypothetical protein
MLMQQTKRVLSLLAVVWMLSSAAIAGADNQTNLREYDGTVNSVDIRQSRMVVSDKLFYLAPDATVTTANGLQSNLLALSPGTRVRMQFEVRRTGPYQATRLVHTITLQR